MASYRRVVTGLNEAGKSCVILDGAAGIAGDGQARTLLMWKSDQAPASNDGNADAADEPSSFAFPRGGSKFVIVHFPPGTSEHNGRGMHASNTLDYGVLLSGRLTIVLEDGEADLGRRPDHRPRRGAGLAQHRRRGCRRAVDDPRRRAGRHGRHGLSAFSTNPPHP